MEPGPDEGELTRGVRLICQDPKVPIYFWAVFAAQLFIGNVEILNTRPAKACVEVITICRCYSAWAKQTF